MSTTNPSDAALQAAYDDPDDPEELTLFPACADEPETCWLTVDLDHAVELAEAA
jgi:hypothetical protein